MADTQVNITQENGEIDCVRMRIKIGEESGSHTMYFQPLNCEDTGGNRESVVLEKHELPVEYKEDKGNRASTDYRENLTGKALKSVGKARKQALEILENNDLYWHGKTVNIEV